MRWHLALRLQSRLKDEARWVAHTQVCHQVVLERKNYLHFGSDAGGALAAVIYTLIGSCKLDGIDPHQACLHHVLQRIADLSHPPDDELLAWRVAALLANAMPERAGKLQAGVHGSLAAWSVPLYLSVFEMHSSLIHRSPQVALPCRIL